MYLNNIQAMMAQMVNIHYTLQEKLHKFTLLIEKYFKNLTLYSKEKDMHS